MGGATVNNNGDLVISRSVINDHGDKNESKLYKLRSIHRYVLQQHDFNDLTTNTQNAVVWNVTPKRLV